LKYTCHFGVEKIEVRYFELSLNIGENSKVAATSDSVQTEIRIIWIYRKYCKETNVAPSIK